MQTHDNIKRDEKYLLMTQTAIKPLVLRMALPTIISMMVTALYNVVDAAFIGHLSTEATAGVGVSFAYMTFIQAFGFYFGHGSGNYMSRVLGAQQYQNAEQMAATGFGSSFLIGLMASILGLCFLPALSQLLGATPDIKDYSNQYLTYILIATPFMMSSLTLNNQLRLQGSAQYAMIGLASGAILNMILDPIFIFGLHWGVRGAAMATACSQLFAWLLLLRGTRLDGNVHLQFKNFQPTWHAYKEITRGGLPSLCRQGLICFSTICLNRAAAFYAQTGLEASTIAAFAIVSRIMMFAFAIILGLGQGFQPVCGFNYGAKLFHRVRASYLFTMTFSTLLLLLMSIFGYIFAPQLIAIFRDADADLIIIGTKVLRWQCAVFILNGLTTPTNMLLQTTGKVIPATFLSACRQGIFFLLVICTIPPLYGLNGLIATQAIADILTFLTATPFAIIAAKRLKNNKEL